MLALAMPIPLPDVLTREKFTADMLRIRATQSDLERRLLNWGEWNRLPDDQKPRMKPVGFWEQFDNRKHREPGWGDLDTVPEPHPPWVDVRDAERLHDIICEPYVFPSVWRKVLALTYCELYTDFELMSRCLMDPNHFLRCLRMARHDVAGKLQFHRMEARKQ